MQHQFRNNNLAKEICVHVRSANKSSVNPSSTVSIYWRYGNSRGLNHVRTMVPNNFDLLLECRYRTIMETAVTEKEFIVQLNQLNHKLNLIKELSFKESKSVDDVKDVLIKLKIKAMSKIRVYLLEQIYKFRKPMTNYQVPQNTMLKYKFFFEFILYNERQVAQEICGEYVETMSKIYYSYFKVCLRRISIGRWWKNFCISELLVSIGCIKIWRRCCQGRLNGHWRHWQNKHFQQSVSSSKQKYNIHNW